MNSIMKTQHHILTLMALATVVLTACQTNEPAPRYLSEDQAVQIAGSNLIAINDLKQPPYTSEKGNYCDPALYRLRANGKGHTLNPALDTVWLFAIDTLPTDRPLYIRGRVTTDDRAGNFYKSLCIQQVVGGKQQGLRISVDAGSLSGMYPLGQELLIRVDGLCIGRYANQPQLCVPSYNNNTYAVKSEEKVGWAPGRIPLADFKARTQLIGTPQTPYCDTMLITDFVNNLIEADNRLQDGLLVCIKDVHYTGQYLDNSTPKNCTTNNPDDHSNGTSANVFAPSTGNMNYPQSRIIADAAGNQTLVSCSEYVKFSHVYLPGANRAGVDGCPSYVGNITGILGYYRDDNYNIRDYKYPAWICWSLSIRSLDDVMLYHVQGKGLWTRTEYGY